MFTSGDYEPNYSQKHRYLVKHQGTWKLIETWAVRPAWDDDVTDVIWLRSRNMITNWQLMLDGRKCREVRIDDYQLTEYWLQVER